MGLINQYRTDKTAAEEGVWVDFGDPNDPIRFRIAYFNHGLAEEVQKLDPADRRLARENRLPATKLLGLIQRATAREIILDWKNMEELVLSDDGEVQYDDQGKPLTVEVLYTPEKAQEILEDETYGELHEFILQTSRSRATFRQDLLQESVGNSPSASAGT